MSFNPSPYLDQVYDTIKSDCLKNKELFVDDKFPPNSDSLFRFQRHSLNGRPVNLTWKRPHEFLTNKRPEFIVDKIVPEDIDQGQLGNSIKINISKDIAKSTFW